MLENNATIKNVKYIEDEKHLIAGVELTMANGNVLTFNSDDISIFSSIWNKVSVRETVVDMIEESVDADEYDSLFDRPIDEDLASNSEFIEAMCDAYSNGEDLTVETDEYANILSDYVADCMNGELANWTDKNFED